MAFDWNQYQQQDARGGIMAPNTPYANTGVAGSNPSGGQAPIMSTAPFNANTRGEAIPPGYTLQNFPGGDTPGSNWGYAPPPTGGGVNTDPNGQVSPSGQRWDQNYFSSTFGTPKTPQELIALESKITAAGGKVLRNASGVAGKIQTPDGRIIDVINSAGAGGNGFQWLEGNGGGGGGMPSSGYGSLNGLSAGYMTSPIGQFQEPTTQDYLNDPGLQFALGEANRMGQNSAAAKGTLLNGRFQQALAASNIGNALQGVGDIYNRKANTFGINFGVQTRNQDAPFDKYYRLSDLGQRATSAS